MDKKFNAFREVICPKENKIVGLKFELTYIEAIIQYFTLYNQRIIFLLIIFR